ncbi:drug/sodium antiporter [gut metagenome]|uniref:Drug/sodium antiporter n=1 Tax=gut metagenome TaxID=749906 RepID=J9G2I8_9ZZZZ
MIGFFKLNSAQVVMDARRYLILVALGMPFSFLNQVLVAIITATGNSHTPFLAMGCGLGVNILLDPLLIFW